MAGDPLHVAFLAHLRTAADNVGVALPWLVKDTRNTLENPDAGAPYIDCEVLPGDERQYTTGAPGANLHQEVGQITIRFNVPLGDAANQSAAGRWADLIRKQFRGQLRTFDCDDRTVTLSSPLRLGYGESEAGMWVEAMAVSYEIFHVG